MAIVGDEEMRIFVVGQYMWLLFERSVENGVNKNWQLLRFVRVTGPGLEALLDVRCIQRPKPNKGLLKTRGPLPPALKRIGKET